MKKALIFIVIIVIVAGVVYFYSKEAKAPAENTTDQTQSSPTPSGASTTPNTQTNVNGNTGPDYTPPQSGGGENLGSNVQVTEVDFDGTKFSPDPVTINVNDYIFFKNKSRSNFWVTSSPTSDYPWLNSGKEVLPGSEFKLQFTVVGGFVYFDKDNPQITGTINVSQ
jgi:plastocyanin